MMGIDPISSRTSTAIWPEERTETAGKDPKATENNAKKASPPYYNSSIESLAQPTTSKRPEQVIPLQGRKAEKAFFAKAKDWLWGILGLNKQLPKTDVAEEQEVTTSNPVDTSVPHLSPPEITDKERMIRAVAELNRILKDEVEGEFDSTSIDKLIFILFVLNARLQKDLKEEDGLHIHKSVQDRLDKNKALQQKHYNIQEEIENCRERLKKMKWVHGSLTAATGAAFATSFFLSGGLAALGVAGPMLTLLKGGATGSNGLIKHQGDLKKGDMVEIAAEMLKNSNGNSDHLTDLQNIQEEISKLHQMIAQLLEKRREAELSASRRG